MGYQFSDDDPIDQSDDELQYEPFEDVEWTDPDELDAIDLDVLDDEVDETFDDANDAAISDDQVVEETDAEELAPARPAGSVLTSTLAPSPTEAEDTPPEPAADAAPAATAAREPEPEVEPDVAESAAPEEGEPAQPIIPPEVYCAVLALPPDVSAGILALRAAGEINTMPPPGVILTPHFRTQDIEAVKTALADWTRIHLPIQLEITGLKADVIGAQQYIAAWTVDPQEELQEAIHVLKRTLAHLILPISGTGNTVGTHIMVGDHIPAERYAHVISQMQRDFETHVWQSTDLHLARRVPETGSDSDVSEGDAPEGDITAWELDQRFD